MGGFERETENERFVDGGGGGFLCLHVSIAHTRNLLIIFFISRSNQREGSRSGEKEKDLFEEACVERTD